MKSNLVLYSKGKNDECYTPAYGVKPILEFIPEDVIVWCPFDTEDSEFVKQISETNKIVNSHIKNDQDFYNHCSKIAQENYTKHFAVDKFYTTVENIYKKYSNRY